MASSEASRGYWVAAAIVVVGVVAAVVWGVAGVLAVERQVADFHRFTRGPEQVVALQPGEYVVYGEMRGGPAGSEVLSYDWSARRRRPPVFGEPTNQTLEVVGPSGETVAVNSYGAALTYEVAGRHGRAAGVFRAEQAGEYRLVAATSEPEQIGQDKTGQTLEVRSAARTVAVGSDLATTVTATVLAPAGLLVVALALAGVVAHRTATRHERATGREGRHERPAVTTHQPSDTSVGGSLRSRWQSVAAGLAGAGALAWLAGRVVAVLDQGADLSQAAHQTPVVLLNVAVPAWGAWLALRHDPRRVRLGLAMVATWGAAFHLPPLVSVLTFSLGNGLPGPGLSFALRDVLPSAVAVAALVAALLALRAAGNRYALNAPRVRKVAAAAIAVAALAPLATLAMDWPQFPTPFFAGPLLSFLVSLAIAAVVWTRDSTTVVPAVLVLTLGALVTALTTGLQMALAMRAGAPAAAGRRPPDPDLLLIQVAAAALLTAAALLLARATRPARLATTG